MSTKAEERDADVDDADDFKLVDLMLAPIMSVGPEIPGRLCRVTPEPQTVSCTTYLLDTRPENSRITELSRA